MKLLVLSDIHLEHHSDEGKSFFQTDFPSCDVVVVAGDFSSGSRLFPSLEALVKRFEGKPIVYVPGNHEFYRHSIVNIYQQLELFARWHKGFHFLNNDTCEINGQWFYGGTMWFPKDTRPEYRVQLSDFSQIIDVDPLAFECNFWFNDNACIDLTPDHIVVSHHLPSYRSVPPQYANDPLNQYFVSEYGETLMSNYQPKLWIHGHTHTKFDYQFEQTRVYCNPMGYPRENPNYVPEVIEV